MLALGPSHVFHFYREPTDMRKGFDGLCGLVRSGMKRAPFSSEVFVFINRRRTYITFLVWDRSGWVLSAILNLGRSVGERILFCGRLRACGL